jgi:TonB-dependent starch-binding outer membrane protein SusC
MRFPASPLARLACAAALLALFSSSAIAQPTGAISGIVFDKTTKQGLAGAQVWVEGTELRTITNDEGRYTLNRVPEGVHTLHSRRMGYAPASERGVIVERGFMSTAYLVLDVTPIVLENVVASVGHLGQESLVVPASQALGSLQGKVAGVRMGRIEGPGSDISLYFRTPVSIRDTRPLVIVDGVVLGAFDGSAGDIPSSNIASIEVLKGAAASAMYGSRGAAGVVIIRTLRGR